MATLTLYKDKLNGVSSAINSMVKSSKDVDTQLGVLKNTLQGVNNGNYDLTINCKNSPSSVGGEMNCNRTKKNTCSGLGNVL